MEVVDLVEEVMAVETAVSMEVVQVVTSFPLMEVP